MHFLSLPLVGESRMEIASLLTTFINRSQKAASRISVKLDLTLVAQL